MMIVVTGETRLAGTLVRELLARGVDVCSSTLDDPFATGRGPLTAIVAEGARDERAALERAIRAVVLRGGAVLLATARELDDPVLVELRRRGVPYTIVRSSGLVDVPSGASFRFVLVPSDVDRAPFATNDDVAREVAGLVADDRIGTGASVDVTMQAGPDAWARALRDAGTGCHVVPRWVAWLAGLVGVPRLELRGSRPRFVVGWEPRVHPQRALARSSA